MIKLECDSCRKPIDPQSDNFIDVPQMTIMFQGKGGRMGNLHLCGKGCFITWLHKNSEPSSIISAMNLGGPSA